MTNEYNQHEYVLTGYKVEWPDGSHEIGEICRNCGNSRIVVKALVAVGGKETEFSSYTTDDKFLNNLGLVHGIFLPTPECPPSAEWQAAAKSGEKVIESWERVTMARSEASRQISYFEEVVSDAEPFLKAAGGAIVDNEENQSDDSGGG